jgi:hypothetical protein
MYLEISDRDSVGTHYPPIARLDLIFVCTMCMQLDGRSASTPRRGTDELAFHRAVIENTRSAV